MTTEALVFFATLYALVVYALWLHDKIAEERFERRRTRIFIKPRKHPRP